MIIGIGHYDVFVHTQAESVRGVKLTLPWTKLSKLTPGVKKTLINLIKNGVYILVEVSFNILCSSMILLSIV